MNTDMSFELTEEHIQFRRELFDVITALIDQNVTHDSDLVTKASLMDALSRLAAWYALEFGYTEKSFMSGMRMTFTRCRDSREDQIEEVSQGVMH